MSFALDGTHNITRQKKKCVDFNDYSPSMDGSYSDSDLLFKAFYDANSLGLPLSLPSGTIKLRRFIPNLCSFFGEPNRTTIIIDDVISFTGAADASHVFQTAWVRTYSSITAKSIFIKDVIISISPQQNFACFGFTNVKSLLIDNVTISTGTTVNPATGYPFKVDSLIDLYACVKNARITNCKLSNTTYARGAASPFDSGGGGEIWVRNLCGSAAVGADLANATENIEIDHNIFTHNTSDEGLAVYGVVGMTRNVKIHHNTFYGTAFDSTKLNYHNTLISVFPLAHATLGTNASVEDVWVTDNWIEDKSWMYSVVRFGNSADTASTNLCRRIRSSGNKVLAYVSTDATYSPHFTWISAGSPGVDPALANLAIRAVQVPGTFGAYKDAALTSDNDTVIVTGDLVFNGFNGFDSVNNPTTLGNVWHGVFSCDTVFGGNIEASNACYYNCRNVSGGYGKTELTDGYIFYVAGNDTYNFTGVKVISLGAVLKVDATSANGWVNMTGCTGEMLNVALYTIRNDSATTLVKSHCNLITGSMAGKSVGVGSLTSSLNKYGATID